jgi:hypothetical protein
MTDTNLPEGTGESTPLTFDEGVSKISDLLSDPETDLQEDDQEQSEEAESEEPEEGDEEEANAEDEDPVDDDEPDGSGDVKGGRFAPDNAKVTLEDGTVTTIAELKRNNLYQRDYTRKTQELSEERKHLETSRSELDQHARAIAAQRDFLLQAAQRFLPQPPDRAMMDSDPIGYMQAKAHYDEQMTLATQIYQARQSEQGRQTEEQQRQAQELRAREAQKLFDTMPELKTPAVYQKFWTESVETMAEYGFTAEDMDQAADHRFYKVFKALAELKRIKSATPKVKETMQSKPTLTGGKRMDPKTKIFRDRQAKREHLRKTGSFEASVSVLEDLIS